MMANGQLRDSTMKMAAMLTGNWREDSNENKMDQRTGLGMVQ